MIRIHLNTCPTTTPLQPADRPNIPLNKGDGDAPSLTRIIRIKDMITMILTSELKFYIMVLSE